MTRTDKAHRHPPTHIDEVVIVSDEEVAEDASLVEVPEADHVLHPLDGGGVHGLDPPLRGQPLLLAVVVHHLLKGQCARIFVSFFSFHVNKYGTV